MIDMRHIVISIVCFLMAILISIKYEISYHISSPYFLIRWEPVCGLFIVSSYHVLYVTGMEASMRVLTVTKYVSPMLAFTEYPKNALFWKTTGRSHLYLIKSCLLL